MNISPQIVAVFFSGLFSGALAGAVFTWWMNKPKPAIASYTLSTATLGGDSTIKGLVPDLRIQVGSQGVPLIHTHTVELALQEGPQVETADLAVTFPSNVRFYGKPQAFPPSALHRIDCTELPNGLKCTLGPLSPGDGNFRIGLAADQSTPPVDVEPRTAPGGGCCRAATSHPPDLSKAGHAIGAEAI